VTGKQLIGLLRFRLRSVSAYCALIAFFFEAGSCRSARIEPSIEISHAPAFAVGSPAMAGTIEGSVKGARSSDRVVLFARSGVWWVQPRGDRVFTEIQSDSKWKNSTHPGSAYAALLVDSRYRPPLMIDVLPEKGGPVLAVANVEDDPLHPSVRSPPSKTLQFSGYQWEILDVPSDRGGTVNSYRSENAWTDKGGFLHLQIRRQGRQWTTAEVRLARSLGYGTYRFVVAHVNHLEPAAVFALSSSEGSYPQSEMDIEVSRWGEPADKNAQFVIQPYVVPANCIRFNTPPGTLTYFLDWQPGRAAFKAVRTSEAQSVAQHVFTSGVPDIGNERIHMALYAFDNQRSPLRYGSQVVVEKFEFLP
jgi:hypothetical protein